MGAVEKSITYYLALLENNNYQIGIKSPIVRSREFKQCISKDTIKKKLLEKLSDKDIQKLSQKARFAELLNVVNNIS